MLMKYRPFDDFDDFARSMQVFQDSVNRWLTAEPAARPWAPPVDVYETGDAIVLKADLPGVKLDDIDVHLENGTLTLKGNREFEKKEEGKGYHRIERSYGSFVRAFTLPDSIDPESINADYKDGLLTVTVGKKEIAKPRSVKVNVRAN